MDNNLNLKVANDKLLILYIIKKSNCKLSFEQLSSLILENELMDYFTFVEYFNELKNSKFFNLDDGRILILSDFSIQILELLEDNIDIILKEKVDNVFSPQAMDIENPEFELIPLNKDKTIVKLAIKGSLDENFSMTFTLDNDKDFERLRENWLNKNKSFYHELLKVILDN